MKFKDKDRDIYFVHIPRTAGSYVEQQMCRKYGVRLDWPKADTDHLFGLQKIGDGNYLTLQHLTVTEMDKYNFIDGIRENWFFSIIRNLFDRVMSLYGWFSSTYTLDEFLSKLKSLNLDNYQFKGIVTENANFNYKNMTQNLEDIKYFVLPQYYYVVNNKHSVNCIKYNDIESLNSKLGLNLSFHPIRKRYSFTEKQIEDICFIYRKDFEYFGFSNNY